MCNWSGPVITPLAARLLTELITFWFLHLWLLILLPLLQLWLLLLLLPLLQLLLLLLLLPLVLDGHVRGIVGLLEGIAGMCSRIFDGAQFRSGISVLVKNGAGSSGKLVEDRGLVLVERDVAVCDLGANDVRGFVAAIVVVSTVFIRFV